MRAITNTAMDSDVRTSPTFILRQATNRDREGPRGLPPPTPPDIRAYPAVRSLQHTHACQGVGELLPTAASRPVGHPAVQATRDWPLPPFRPALPLSTPTMPSADAATAISLDDFAAKPVSILRHVPGHQRGRSRSAVILSMHQRPINQAQPILDGDLALAMPARFDYVTSPIGFL
jgi:hypothetical protein